MGLELYQEDIAPNHEGERDRKSVAGGKCDDPGGRRILENYTRMILLYIMRERGGGYNYTRMALPQIMGERGVVRAIPG